MDLQKYVWIMWWQLSAVDHTVSFMQIEIEAGTTQSYLFLLSFLKRQTIGVWT